MRSKPEPQAQPTDTRDMRAVVQDRYGAVEVLHQERIARPEATGNEVLVRVHAAGLDRGTWHLMTGKPYLMRIAGLGFPGAEGPGARAGPGWHRRRRRGRR